ncbi:MAG: VOC family protein [Acidimicrobiia bacterium]|nr:VOC family protein [Acidimicrobiia bacterium]
MSDSGPIPEGMSGVIPHLVCDGASDALDFYTKAFDAVDQGRTPGPDGRLMHAAMTIDGSWMFLADDMPEMNDGKSSAPSLVGTTTVAIHRYVTDVDAAVDKAVAAGATVRMPAADMFWGDRYAVVVDPWGHEWSLASHQRDVSPEEMAAAMEAMVREG